MKKIFTTVIILLAMIVGHAQITTLTFVGKDRSGQDYVKLDHVSVFNQDQLWHEVLYYPDTTLRLGAVGIENYTENGFQLMQNVPNPFDGTTDFALTLPSGQNVSLEIYDLAGKLITDQQFSSLAAGTHLFRATLSAPQTYLLSATTHEGKTSIKMINTGDGGSNSILYLGMTNVDGSITLQLKNGKGNASYPFNRGDRMQYTGYAIIDGIERVSQEISKQQNGNETINLKFDVERPNIITNDCSNLHATAVSFNGEVTSDNNALVNERGFCFLQGTAIPTISNNRILAGSGEGIFSAYETNLDAGKDYKVRAYAINTIGITYGEPKTFTTLDTLAVVATTQADSITSTSFVSGGEVLITNCYGTLSSRGICWNTNGTPTIADNTVVDAGTGVGTFVSTVTGLEPATTYHVRAYATNNAGTAYGEEYTVTTLCDLPIVTTTAISGISSRTANGGGEVINEHGMQVTARGICWNTTGTPDLTDTHTTISAGLRNFTSEMNDLIPSTTYYVRAYATNGMGTAYGEEVSFTTLCDIPELTTTQPSNTTSTSFKSGGNVITNNCTSESLLSRGVCWGTTRMPTVDGNHTNDGNNVGTFVSTVTGLEPATTYYVRAYATNSQGTAYGAEYTVTTLCDLPIVTTAAISGISSRTASGGGEVINQHGMPVDYRGICWNTVGTPTTADAHTIDGAGLGTFTSVMDSLTPSTTYYVRAYATNSMGTSYGVEVSFTTSCDLPELTTAQHSSITSTSFVSGGNVLVVNCSGTITARGICWNMSGMPTITENHTTDSIGIGSFVSNVNNLEPATTYYVRAYATNSMGTAYGEEDTVTTLCDLPIITTSAISNILSRTANGGGEVVNEHGKPVTVRGICWSTTGTPTTADAHTADGVGLGSFTSVMNNLVPSTTYHVRAYATNDMGTAYGDEVTFTTLCDLPELTTMQPDNIESTGFTTGGSVSVVNCVGSISARGICWNTTGTPTIADSHTTDGTGLGNFVSNITGLNCNTTYYVRAYATNGWGTGYGEEFTVTTLPATQPELVIYSIAHYGGTGMITNAEALVANCEAVAARGICWSTTQNPTINDAHTTNGAGLGTFSDTVTGLLPMVTYYVRAYATNSVGTAYSEELSLNTYELPTVTTDAVSSITYETAFCGGNVTSDGGNPVTARGICWSTTQNPTITNAHTTNGTGEGSFTNAITGLVGGTTYYVRAYATNVEGTAYGNQVEFTTIPYSLPTVTTSNISNIAETSAISGGEVLDEGGYPVTARGVCWSMTENPTISDAHTTDGSGLGNYTSAITNLSVGNTYYVRAYATNNMGTAYGEQKSFIAFSCGITLISDADENIYHTVKMGTQCWMKENLKTTKYADGTVIENGTTTSNTESYWYYPNNTSYYKATYGLLYNWKAVMRNSTSSAANPSCVQGICPDGWHVPSDAEWKQMEMYMGLTQTEADNTGYRGNIAVALSANTGWNVSRNTSVPGNTSSSGFNTSAFSALPASYYDRNYYTIGGYSAFWCATEVNNSTAFCRYLNYNNVGVYRNSTNKYYGYSVRCVRDIAEVEGSGCTPTSSVQNVSIYTTQLPHTLGAISFPAGTESGTYNFFITNAAGCDSAVTINLTVSLPPCSGTITDYENNVYNIIQIGNQCWMNENLRSTKYSDGSSISQGSRFASTTTAYWYYPNNSSANKSTYGLLYNWKAVMRNSSSIDENPSGVQGICPTGWHVPSDAEWTQLTNYVSTQSLCCCNSNTNNIAKALASTTGWTNNNTSCAVGNSQDSNNASGFNAMPAGYFNGNYSSFGTAIYIWSTSVDNRDNAYFRNLNYNSAIVTKSSTSKNRGYSVRCVRD